MLDHISIRVQDLPRALAFYRAALAPIGYEVLMEFPEAVGLGADGKPDLWLMKSDQPVNPTDRGASAPA
jgi:catechol 2,3-dioxygenase-like lactoylglutathione lyase family enzyme